MNSNEELKDRLNKWIENCEKLRTDLSDEYDNGKIEWAEWCYKDIRLEGKIAGYSDTLTLL